MGSGNISAIISAASGICGVVLGAALTAFREWAANRAGRRTDTIYLAIIVVSHLDRLANRCIAVALDDGTAYGMPAGKNGAECEPTVVAPEFLPLDLDVEWKLLPQDLLYDIFCLPDEREQIQTKLAGIAEYEDNPPEHTEWFWARRRGYAELGLKASALARRLREHARLPINEPAVDEYQLHDWRSGKRSRDQELRKVVSDIDEAIASSERISAEYRREHPFLP